MTIKDIPEFLRIPQDERKAAWEKFRAAHPPPVEQKPTYRPISGIPGAKDGDTDS
jgi:hypothetical protein